MANLKAFTGLKRTKKHQRSARREKAGEAEEIRAKRYSSTHARLLQNTSSYSVLVQRSYATVISSGELKKMKRLDQRKSDYKLESKKVFKERLRDDGDEDTTSTPVRHGHNFQFSARDYQV